MPDQPVWSPSATLVGRGAVIEVPAMPSAQQTNPHGAGRAALVTTAAAVPSLCRSGMAD